MRTGSITTTAKPENAKLATALLSGQRQRDVTRLLGNVYAERLMKEQLVIIVWIAANTSTPIHQVAKVQVQS